MDLIRINKSCNKKLNRFIQRSRSQAGTLRDEDLYHFEETLVQQAEQFDAKLGFIYKMINHYIIAESITTIEIITKCIAVFENDLEDCNLINMLQVVSAYPEKMRQAAKENDRFKTISDNFLGSIITFCLKGVGATEPWVHLYGFCMFVKGVNTQQHRNTTDAINFTQGMYDKHFDQLEQAELDNESHLLEREGQLGYLSASSYETSEDDEENAE